MVRKVVGRAELYEVEIAIHHLTPIAPQMSGDHVAFGQLLDRSHFPQPQIELVPGVAFGEQAWRAFASE